MIDKIIVTGCSHSTGIEIVDHLIRYPSEKNRRSAIWQWYRKNIHNHNKVSIEELDKKSNEMFHSIERQHSWPALLEKETRISVINLSVIGGSVGRNLIEFSNYCKENKIKDTTIAIHQLPSLARFYMRFSNHRVNILPNNIDNLGYDKKYFKKDIERVKERYKMIIEKDIKNNYIKKHYHRCIERIKKIGQKHGIIFYFISLNNTNIHIDNILIEDFDKFRDGYKKGILGHPVDTTFNKDIVDIIVKTIKLI